MNKEQLKNLALDAVSTRLEETAAKSLINCHAVGLHSIMLRDEAERRVRIFVAEKGNTLNRNFPSRVFDNSSGMSVAFHPHHCAVELLCLAGSFWNWTVEPYKNGWTTYKFLYQSEITGGKIGFEPLGLEELQTVKFGVYTTGESIKMRAGDIHTVACKADSNAAWAVFEGKEDAGYQPFCWSNHDLTTDDFSMLYKPITATEVIDKLKIAELLD